jgi:uncharacterized protein
VAALALTGLTACGREEPKVPEGPLRIATGSSGGVYYQYGQALRDVVDKRVPQLRPSVLETVASGANIRLVVDGVAEVGFTQADIASEAFHNGQPLVAIARLYNDYLHLVVRRDSKITKLKDLEGKKVSVGAPDSGTVFTVTQLLKVAEVKQVEARGLNLDQSVAALRDGQIDAFFFNGGLPVRAIQDLAPTLSINLVDLSDHVKALRAAHPSFYTEHAIPSSTYQLLAIRTIGVPNYLVVSASMPEATAYALTRALFQGRDVIARSHRAANRLNAREAINTDPLPLHPGAVRYYREIKR